MVIGSVLQGTWCAIDTGLAMKETANVKHMVKEMRQQRVGMVQTCEQFDFVHKALNKHKEEVCFCERGLC